MTGMNTSDVLKQLQGSQIEKIGVITNPSARYDAEEEVGIINIILKRNRREGINCTVNATFGYPNNYGGGFNITLKKKNFSVFTGYDISYRDSPGSKKTNQEFTYPDTSFSYTSDTKMDRSSLNHNFRLGTEINLNNYNSLTISGRYSIGDGTNENTLIYEDFDKFDVATQTVKRLELEDKFRNSHDISFNYRKTFKRKEQLLTFDVSQSERIDNENSTISQTNDVDVTDNSEDRIFNNESSNNWILQTDYVQPIKKGKLELGLKSSIKEIKDDYGVEEFIDSSNSWEFLPDFKNLLIYHLVK